MGVDVQYPWERVPSRFHESTDSHPAVLHRQYPVTNAEFKKFQDATRYRPTTASTFCVTGKTDVIHRLGE